MGEKETLRMEGNHLSFSEERLKVLKGQFVTALRDGSTIIAAQNIGNCYVSIGRIFKDKARTRDNRWISVSFPEFNMRFRLDANLQLERSRINCERIHTITIGDKVLCRTRNNPRWNTTLLEGEYMNLKEPLEQFFSECEFILIPAVSVNSVDIY
ncbi:hypothetical protein KC675_02940 [Candidatus Dojkabacteria bacterium]|uniref:Uncharacterized protein n=1 Tax=Candidatus Dojkabacteria bacterium TaxID=2099670 RepID=A0A955I8S4_9BACT|nr:hypothetical protein [Candidatus Dojkabacteria bacterium]